MSVQAAGGGVGLLRAGRNQDSCVLISLVISNIDT
jgi:hypothetical protein